MQSARVGTNLENEVLSLFPSFSVWHFKDDTPRTAKMSGVGLLVFYIACNIILSTLCSACAAYHHELSDALRDPNVHVDVLCGCFLRRKHPLVSYVTENFKIRTWCGCWKKYIELLKGNIRLNMNTLIILPMSVLNASFHRDFPSSLDDYPLTKWVVLSENEYCGARIEDVSALNSTRIIVRPGDIDFNQYAFWIKNRATRRRAIKTQIQLTRLTNRHLLLGCLVDEKLKGQFHSLKSGAFQEALRALKIPIIKVPIHIKASVEFMNRNKVDVVNADVALDPNGFASAYYPGIRHHHHVVYFVGQKAVRQGNVVSFWPFLEFFSVLFACLVGCLLMFNVINYCSGRNAPSDIADTCMALVAAVLMLSSAVPRNFERSSSGRTVLISWFMAGFSLSVYCQSLLTSSVTSGTRWEADDTPAKLRPKLTQGKVSICTEQGTYCNFLLETSLNDTDVLGAMSRAVKYNPNIYFSGTVHECLQKAARSTHVFLSENWNPCDVVKLGKYITIGREPIQALFSGHPVRKDFPYRREIGFIIKRIFESGWDKRIDSLSSWNCSSSANEPPPIVPIDVTRFLSLYFVCCGFAVVVLVLEISVNWFNSIGEACVEPLRLL